MSNYSIFFLRLSIPSPFCRVCPSHHYSSRHAFVVALAALFLSIRALFAACRAPTRVFFTHAARLAEEAQPLSFLASLRKGVNQDAHG